MCAWIPTTKWRATLRADSCRMMSNGGANAFAVQLLAPTQAVKQLVPDVGDVSAASIADVMSTFGIGRAAARFHVWNAWWRAAVLPPESEIHAQPSDEQRAAGELHPRLFPHRRRPGAAPRSLRAAYGRGCRGGSDHH